MSSPRVSVCVPVYNGMPYVLTTIRSVIAQTYTDWELVVTDNGSSDGSAAAIERLVAEVADPRIRCQFFPNATGLPADWNRALALSGGSLFKLLPCDDILHPDCLSRQVSALASYPDASFVVCRRRIIDSSGRVRLLRRATNRLTVLDSTHARRLLLAGGRNLLGEPGCGLTRMDMVRRLGGFETRFRYYPDIDFWYRCLLKSQGLRVDAHLCDFRIHGGSQTAARRADYVTEYSALLEHHATSLRATRLETSFALVKARAVAKARSFVIDRILRSDQT